MAKSPRKGSVSQKSAGYSQKLNPNVYKLASYAGKNLKSYQFNSNRRSRRFSIADSSDSDSDAKPKHASDSDSESSLTAMSEKDEDAASRKGSVFFASKVVKKPKKTVRAVKSTKKRVPKKSYNPQHYLSDSDNDEDQHVKDYNMDDEDDGSELAIGLGDYYNTSNAQGSGSSDSDSNDDEDDDSQDENSFSSSDDSAVDFVQLQAERRAKSKKSLKTAKVLELVKPAQDDKKKRRSSYGRRKSEVALPDINFKFEFDDTNTASVIEKDSEEDEEEDIGEEVKEDPNSYTLNVQFDEPLMHVPKIKDDELNSDDDYEYDDNDLLATLQADNDIDEFITGNAPPVVPRTRNSSFGSLGDDTEDPFLREEEKYLVNEFETNGFDNDEEDRMQTARAMDSFNSQRAEVLEYASSSENSQYSEDTTTKAQTFEEDDDADDYDDFIDFDVPLFEETESSVAPKKHESEQKKKHKHKRRGPLDSEDDDDSYLWNYFFSSDGESPASEGDPYDVEEQLILEEIFRQDKQEFHKDSSLEPVEELEYDSGESTDVDLSLPPTNQNQLGSKMAKEVLSSKTADYRPPVLGTWIAIESEPFGIIDGLLTRTLNNYGAKNPRKGWRSINFGKTELEDSAIELDELLNISELDNDDENDIRIWRDFNNREKQVPLGAFRNKSHLNPVIVPEPMAGFSTSKMNTDFNSKKVKRKTRKPVAPPKKEVALPSKLKRRSASIADAVSEGYRPTKSGLFSENVLADVEEVLGDDRDFMALIKGL